MNVDDNEYEIVWHGASWRSAPNVESFHEHIEKKRMAQGAYQFRPSGGLAGEVNRPKGGANPQVIGERLEHIRRRKGRLTPQLVVDDARPPSSPLHHYFEWNDDKAAEHFRVFQARQIIKAVYVVQPSMMTEGAAITRAFVSVDRNEDAHFEPIATVLSDAAMYAEVCRRARAELIAFQERYMEFFMLKQIAKDAIAAIDNELQNAEKRSENIA